MVADLTQNISQDVECFIHRRKWDTTKTLGVVCWPSVLTHRKMLTPACLQDKGVNLTIGYNMKAILIS